MQSDIDTVKKIYLKVEFGTCLQLQLITHPILLKFLLFMINKFFFTSSLILENNLVLKMVMGSLISEKMDIFKAWQLQLRMLNFTQTSH